MKLVKWYKEVRYLGVVNNSDLTVLKWLGVFVFFF